MVGKKVNQIHGEKSGEMEAEAGAQYSSRLFLSMLNSLLAKLL